MALVAAIGYWMWQQRADLEPTGEDFLIEVATEPVGNGRTEVRTVAAAPTADPEAERVPSPVAQRNRQGLEAMKQRRYADAVEHFRSALELEPADKTLRLNLARALMATAQQWMDGGEVQRAEKLLQEAANTHADGGHSQSRLAQAWVRLGRRQQAAQLLSEVLKVHTECAPAWRAQAEIAFADGELELAVHSMEKALALTPDSLAFEQRLQFFRREQQMLASFLRVRSTRFDAMYDANNPKIQPHLQQLLFDLEAASDAVNAQLGLQPMDRLLVLLLSPNDYLAGAPNWSNGLYDGRIRVPFDGSSPPDENLRATFRHEYTHAALHRVGPTIATWLHEGIAQFVEGKNSGMARAYLKAQALPSLDKLQGNWTVKNDAAEVRGYYAYALSLSAWMVEQFGQDALAQLVTAMQSQGQEEAFQSTFGMGITELDQRHRQRLGPEGN